MNKKYTYAGESFEIRKLFIIDEKYPRYQVMYESEIKGYVQQVVNEHGNKVWWCKSLSPTVSFNDSVRSYNDGILILLSLYVTQEVYTEMVRIYLGDSFCKLPKYLSKGFIATTEDHYSDGLDYQLCAEVFLDFLNR